MWKAYRKFLEYKSKLCNTDERLNIFSSILRDKQRNLIVMEKNSAMIAAMAIDKARLESRRPVRS